MAEEWYILNNIDHFDTPALVIYPERVRHNIELLKNSIDEVSRLRVHAKTHKCAEATRLLLEAGISKFKCATIAEAEMLAQSGAPDVLLAYQPTGFKVDRFVQLIQLYPHTSFSCLIDNDYSAKQISEAAVAARISIPIYIDLNVGMNRTGIMPGSGALQLYLTCAKRPGLKVMGLHAYDGHIHDSDLAKRREECDVAYAHVEQLSNAVIEQGLPAPVIVAGGSPTFPIHAERGEVECSPGTFIYWDWGYHTNFAEQAFLPAALIIMRVISKPAPDKICLDAGHKSIASESSLDKRIHFLNAPQLKIIGHSEEHLVATTGGQGFNIGDIVYGVPYHVCPTAALYERALIAEHNEITGEWKTIARDRKITI